MKTNCEPCNQCMYSSCECSYWISISILVLFHQWEMMRGKIIIIDMGNFYLKWTHYFEQSEIKFWKKKNCFHFSCLLCEVEEAHFGKSIFAQLLDDVKRMPRDGWKQQNNTHPVKLLSYRLAVSAVTHSCSHMTIAYKAKRICNSK